MRNHSVQPQEISTATQPIAADLSSPETAVMSSFLPLRYSNDFAPPIPSSPLSDMDAAITRSPDEKPSAHLSLRRLGRIFAMIGASLFLVILILFTLIVIIDYHAELQTQRFILLSAIFLAASLILSFLSFVFSVTSISHPVRASIFFFITNLLFSAAFFFSFRELIFYDIFAAYTFACFFPGLFFLFSGGFLLVGHKK